MSAEETGNFRRTSVYIKPSIKSFTAEAQENYFITAMGERFDDELDEESKAFNKRMVRRYLKEQGPREAHKIEQQLKGLLEQEDIYETCFEKYPLAQKWVEAWEADWKKQAEEVNTYIAALSQQLSVPAIASLTLEGTAMRVKHECLSPEQEEKVIQQIFDTYHEKMDAINLKLQKASSEGEIEQLFQEKIESIAKLYQILEWLHPFTDGSGRTNLVVQAKLLSEQGLNPAILDEPYFANWSTLSSWKDYLSDGIKRWRIEKAKQQSLG
jgi:hypothetical protein